MVRKRNSSQRAVAIVLGAGQGTRMGYQINKVFLPLNGKPIIIYAVETFEHCPGVDEIILVAAAGEEEQLAKLARYANCDKVRHVVRGGASRHASELCALEVEVNSENYVQRSFEGEQAWKAQTPQAFQAPLLLKAYDEAKRNLFYGTDTAASVELIGGHVAIVESDAINLKITTAHDLFLAERLCGYRRF